MWALQKYLKHGGKEATTRSIEPYCIGCQLVFRFRRSAPNRRPGTLANSLFESWVHERLPTTARGSSVRSRTLVNYISNPIIRAIIANAVYLAMAADVDRFKLAEAAFERLQVTHRLLAGYQRRRNNPKQAIAHF